MTALWFRARLWYANRLLDLAEWTEAVTESVTMTAEKAVTQSLSD